MTVLLVLVAVFIALGAATFLTQATLGVALMALACLFGMFARLAQAAGQHAELKRLVGEKGAGAPPAGS